MAPPSYSDLGKAARDLFSKGYNYGFFKLEAKTKTDSGVEFTTSGNSSSDTGKVCGNLETKYKWSEYGLTFTEKWNTDNVLNTEITIEDQLTKGLKLAFDTSFAPQTGKKSGKIKTGYKQDYVNVNADVDFDFAGPTIHGAAVLGWAENPADAFDLHFEPLFGVDMDCENNIVFRYNGWLAGYQMSFDTAKSKLAKSNFAVGFTSGDFTLHTSINDGQEFAGSIYQRVSPELETAVNLSWTSGTNATRFALGAKYTLDENASVSAKVNNSSQIGLGYSQKLRDGVKLTLSALIEGKSINQGGHKVGLGLDLEA